MKEFINETLIPKVMRFVSTKPMVGFRNGMLYTMPFQLLAQSFYYSPIFQSRLSVLP